MKIVNAICMLAVVALVAGPAFAQECPSGKCPSQSTSAVAQQEGGCSGGCPSQSVAKEGGCCSQSAVATVAKQEEGKSCSQCPSQSAVATVAAQEKSECSQCPVEKAMANLPKMTYKVGKESTCCDKSAAAMAKKSEKPIHFVVGDKTFEKKDKAYVALVESTEAFVTKFTTACKCEKSGKTTIAGTSCGCPVEAGKKTELVKTAIKDMKITYKVGKETTCCNKSASELVKKSGEKMTYVVAGKETCCNLEARLNLAKAKYAAAVKAMVVTEKKTEAAAKSAG